MTAAQDFTKLFPSFDKLVAFHQANFEALIQANTLFVKGAQEISKEIFAQAQAQLESAASSGQAALKAKDLKAVAQLNADTAKLGYEKLVASSTKLSEMGVKVATEAFAPVTARLNAAVETLFKTAA
ncbi:MAG TPA: phasin family protein [Aliidongia sp.]|nr:phasin family protein [Aliidongia sp.]